MMWGMWCHTFYLFLFILFVTFGNSQSRSDTDTEPRRMQREKTAAPSENSSPSPSSYSPTLPAHTAHQTRSTRKTTAGRNRCGVLEFPTFVSSTPPHPRFAGPRGCRSSCAQLRHPFYDIPVTPTQRAPLLPFPFPPHRPELLLN